MTSCAAAPAISSHKMFNLVAVWFVEACLGSSPEKLMLEKESCECDDAGEFSGS